ncbi:MAG TPA: EthD family reductase [Casimicrobiaceae bacterium]
MAKLIAMYKVPADKAAFDLYYHSTHVPIAKKVPGLRHYEISRGPVVTLDGLAPYHLVAILTFDSVTAIQAALASPEGQATAADLGRFAMAGVDLYILDTTTV